MKDMHVIATAGHVDHGKSTLVEALTGINPDRLKEEKERQMTIDLGFAWMTLPSGESIGIVDVPGHRDFIENMLAGVGGIDAVVLVIAADEGVMPQTREHLAIVDLLGVPIGVIALTKIDLVEDQDWLTLVRDEVKDLVAGTRLEDATIVNVSGETSEGLEDLIAAIAEALREAPKRNDIGRPRLPIDRVFTIAGFGTVVTGTLIDGALEVGQAVEILPTGIKGRIRGLQTHKTKIDSAVSGSRVAANISGVEVREIVRGDVVVLDNTYEPTRVLDVQIRLLPDAVSSLRHDTRVKLFIGSAQRLARVRLLRMEPIRPGEKGWLQLVLDRPVVASRGDRYILRRPSPGATLGGGLVADPHPSRFYRRKDKKILERLGKLLEGSSGEVLTQSLTTLGPSTLQTVIAHSRLDQDSARLAINELLESDALIAFGDRTSELQSDSLISDRGTWEKLLERIHDLLESFHTNNPLRIGMPREELMSRLRLQRKTFIAILTRAVKEGFVVESGPSIRLPDHQITLEPSEQDAVDKLLSQFRASPFVTPSVKECIAELGEELMTFLVESGQIVQLSADVVLEDKAYEEMVAGVKESILGKGQISVAEVRDRFDTSRKYALALMEHLDAIGFTIRDGDVRRLV
jgi:selenocysteine-specific elongation factor